MTQAVLGLWAVAIVFVAAARPAWTLAAAMVLSVFDGAAIVNAGGTAVSPYYFFLLLVAARCVTVKVRRGSLLGHTPAVRQAIGTAALLAVLGVAGAIVLPRVFAGWQVHSPRLAEEGTAALVPSGSNLGQAAYLVLNVLLMWSAAQQADPAAAAKSAVRGLMIAGTVVVGLAFYELAATLAHLPFPEDVLRSNDNFVMQAGTSVGDMPRICSTYTEPSSMAVFLVGLVAFLTSGVGRAARAAWRVPLLIGAVAVLLLSTSSTGYVGLGAVAAWRVTTNLLVPMLHGRLSAKKVGLTVGGLTVVAAVLALSPDLRDLIQKMVFEKDQSSSYEERTGANTDALKLAVDTLGLGAGLGSNRASGFVQSTLSTMGVWGVGVLAVLLVLLLRRPREAGVRVTEWHRGLSAGLLGLLAAKCISSPDLNTPTLWALLAGLVAVHAAADVVPAEVVQTATPLAAQPIFRGTRGLGA